MDGSTLEWHIFLNAASSQKKKQAIWKICLESMHLTKLLFSSWQTVCPSFPSCHPELQMPGWSHRCCERKRVGACSPGASQRAAGKLCLPGVVALSGHWCQLCTEHQAEGAFYRFAHRFSFSWNSLMCTRLHPPGICAGSSEPWEESREGTARDVSENTMHWYPPPSQTLNGTSHRNSCQMVADLN